MSFIFTQFWSQSFTTPATPPIPSASASGALWTLLSSIIIINNIIIIISFGINIIIIVYVLSTSRASTMNRLDRWVLLFFLQRTFLPFYDKDTHIHPHTLAHTEHPHRITPCASFVFAHSPQFINLFSIFMRSANAKLFKTSEIDLISDSQTPLKHLEWLSALPLPISSFLTPSYIFSGIKP